MNYEKMLKSEDENFIPWVEKLPLTENQKFRITLMVSGGWKPNDALLKVL